VGHVLSVIGQNARKFIDDTGCASGLFKMAQTDMKKWGNLCRTPGVRRWKISQWAASVMICPEHHHDDGPTFFTRIFSSPA